VEKTMKKIGIVGSRRRNTYQDYLACVKVFNEVYEPDDTIVSGGCPKGGDVFANRIAKERGLTITIHYPDWRRFGKSAGFKRNTLIANDCDVLIAVVVPERTGGTEDTVAKCNKQNKQVYLA
jgi:predicted Rossmann fold nucleotide-binding protein DprA/Smf involved in DNA uptake